MKLDELEFFKRPLGLPDGAEVYGKDGRPHAILKYEDGTYSIFEGVRVGHGACGRIWLNVPPIVAQCILLQLLDESETT